MFLAVEEAMVKSDMVIEQSIREFLAAYGEKLKALALELDRAGISHYSSGCGSKSLTFDIFPASAHIQELFQLLTLDRAYRPRTAHGMRDASSAGNPATDFILYMKRWSGFAEQVMQYEGASPRGVAAARAKLLMEELCQSLSQGTDKRRASDFTRLMDAIGRRLLHKTQEKSQKSPTAASNRNKYLEALAAAQNQSNAA